MHKPELRIPPGGYHRHFSSVKFPTEFSVPQPGVWEDPWEKWTQAFLGYSPYGGGTIVWDSNPIATFYADGSYKFSNQSITEKCEGCERVGDDGPLQEQHSCYHDYIAPVSLRPGEREWAPDGRDFYVKFRRIGSWEEYMGGWVDYMEESEPLKLPYNSPIIKVVSGQEVSVPILKRGAGMPHESYPICKSGQPHADTYWFGIESEQGEVPPEWNMSLEGDYLKFTPSGGAPSPGEQWVTVRKWHPEEEHTDRWWTVFKVVCMDVKIRHLGKL